MEKITITLCCGTYCHIMGGAEIQLLDEMLPPGIAEHVDIRYSSCLGYCREGYGDPPFVEINGVCMPESSVAKICRRITEILGGAEDGSK